MKVNLCMIIELLAPSIAENIDILDKSPHIEALRICKVPEGAADPGYLYLCSEHGRILLLNGQDSVCIPDRSYEDVMNRLIAIFEQFREWEQQLNAFSLKRDLHGLVDYGTKILNNPLMLSDPLGNVLAMSSQYLNNDYNTYWDCARQKGILPLEVLSAPMYNTDGNLVSWGTDPQILKTEDGNRLIGSFIKTDDEPGYGLGLWEAGHVIQEGDLLLFRYLSDAIAQALEPEEKNLSGYDLGNLLAGVLVGEKVRPALILNVESCCPAPWSLVLVRSPFRNDTVYRNSLLYRLEQNFRSCIPFFYNEMLLILVSGTELPSLLNHIADEKDKLYYQALYSPLFDDLDDMKLRLDQCLYTLDKIGETPGFCNCEAYSFPYLLHQLEKSDGIRHLTHSALKSLKQYDECHSTEYYRSLFLYLRNDRSILESAADLHIHKNTMLYRLQKITALLHIDLNDPEERNYLLLSFYIENAFCEDAESRGQ